MLFCDVRSQGMITLAPVAAGQVLLRVPTSLLMTQKTAMDSQLCGSVVRQGLTEWQVGMAGSPTVAADVVVDCRTSVLFACMHLIFVSSSGQ